MLVDTCACWDAFVESVSFEPPQDVSACVFKRLFSWRVTPFGEIVFIQWSVKFRNRFGLRLSRLFLAGEDDFIWIVLAVALNLGEHGDVRKINFVENDHVVFSNHRI